MNVLSLFAGIGGLDLGLERAGMTVVGQVEIDPFCQRVLAKHWPEVPRHDDVRSAVDWWRSEPRPIVHVVVGGPPCQPFSAAGRRRGVADARWGWPWMADVVRAVRPDWVVVENVPGLRRRGLAAVLGDLAGLGYRARAGLVSACAVGAPHPRQRLFVLAHTEGHGRGTGSAARPDREGPHLPPRDGVAGVSDANRVRPDAAGPGWWTTEPEVGRVAHGVPAGVDRRRALGNAVVPQVAEHIGRLILGAAHEEAVGT